MCHSELTELTEFAAELSEFSLPKQCSRNSIPPVPVGRSLGRACLHPFVAVGAGAVELSQTAAQGREMGD